ncbi:hypothetical protein BGX27_000480, partial [Mortierella sp. AM989]
EYSLNVKSSMSQLASLSGVSPLSSTSQSDRTTSALQPKLSSSSNSQNARRSQRSGSDSLSTSGLSPAALKLIKQKEQQQLEEETEYIQKNPGGARHSSHHQTDDEDHRRSVTHGHSRISVSESVRPHRRKASESGHESISHSHVTGYESSSKFESQQQQNPSFRDRHDSRTTSAADGDNAKRSTGGVDASAFTMLYKEIRDSMDASSFGMFARVVTAFNEGDKTTEETLDEVGKIVKDRALNQRFRDLIHQAIAEKDNQLENNVGDRSMEGDLTMEIDQSLLLDDDQDPEEDHVSNSQKDEERDDSQSIQEYGELLKDQVEERDPDGSILEEAEQIALRSDANSNAKRNVMSSDEIDVNDENKLNMAAHKSTRKQTI